jgi:hypothetical protein
MITDHALELDCFFFKHFQASIWIHFRPLLAVGNGSVLVIVIFVLFEQGTREPFAVDGMLHNEFFLHHKYRFQSCLSLS